MIAVPALPADPAAVRVLGLGLLAAASGLDEAEATATRAASTPRWQGRAARAQAVAARRTATRAGAASLALRSLARRLQDHAEALTGLLARRAVLVERGAALLAPGAVPDPVGADALRAEVAAWVGDVEAGTGALVAALAGLDTTAEVVRAWGRVVDPADAALAALPAGRGSGVEPTAAAAWWRGLAPGPREAVVVAAPGLVGGLDGLPATTRDEANVLALHRDLARLAHREQEGCLGERDRVRWSSARAARRALDLGPPGSLLHDYDPDAFDGDGALSIALGDPDRADDVGVLVPGLGTDARSGPHQVGRARHLLEAAAAADPARTTSVLAWIGYDAPSRSGRVVGDAAGVLTDDAARRGGAHLAGTVEGLRAARADERAGGAGPDGGAGRAHLSVVAHSYGSTTAALAAHDHGLDADELVLLGSPGAGRDVDHATDTGLGVGHVWVGAHSRDPVTRLGNHGAWHLEALEGLGLGDDPAEDDFGARRLRAESDGDPHTSYLDPGGEALGNVALVVTGHGDEVTLAEPRHDPWWGPVSDPERTRADRPSAGVSPGRDGA